MAIPRHRSAVDNVLATSIVASTLGPMTMNCKREYPCDYGPCPFGESNRMYFCRDNCGLGVDEEYDDYPDGKEIY